MKAYVVTKNITLQANGREYFKDQIITASEVGKGNIERYISKGYVQELGSVDTLLDDSSDIGSAAAGTVGSAAMEGKDAAFSDGDTEEYLSTDEINALPKNQLIAYAQKIGMPDIKSSAPLEELRRSVDDYIESITGDKA